MPRSPLGARAPAAFPYVLARHASPIDRAHGSIPDELQRGKEVNVRLAAARLDGMVVQPGQVFSHHHAIGRPSRARGFRRGLELRDGRPSAGIGGGLCQVSNAMYWVAAQAGMRIVERHRHGLDLFPDDRRTVPFGCGATIVYRTTDLRWRNPLSVAVAIRASADDGRFALELRTEADPMIRVEVWEVDHRFVPDAGGWIRENRLRRRITALDGSVLVDEELARNRGRVMYEPTPEQLACGGVSPKQPS